MHRMCMSWPTLLPILHAHHTLPGEMSKEIDAETERHLKNSPKVVSPDPIYLTVYSPNVPNLTLVDMPGTCACAYMRAYCALLHFTAGWCVPWLYLPMTPAPIIRTCPGHAACC